MGFNTTIMLLNDRLGDIENDVHFGRNLSHDVGCIGYPDIPSLAVGAKVIETHHNSSMSIVAVGHNIGITLGYSGITGRDLVNEPDEAKIAMLKDFASQLGFKLIRSRKS